MPRAVRHARHRFVEALENRQLLAATEPIINEFMASNKTGITDLCGQTSDWIEIYNPTAAPVNMAGWHLSNDIAIPDQWTFPNININANGYLLVWAGDCNQVDPTRPQASFKLDPDGEYLALTRPDNTPATEFNPNYPEQVNDTSYGLSSTGVYQYMTSETPGAANIDGASGLVADTKFDVDRGLFNAPFQLNITTTTAGATIRYTTNGSPPTATTGTVYSGPITIDHTTTIRAAAFKTSYISSDVDTQTYLFLKDVINQPNLKISSITRIGTVATVTTPVPHGFTNGATILIYGADQTQYNTPANGAPFTITSVPTSTTFTYTVVNTAVTPATGVNLRIGNPPGYPGNWLTYADGTPATADYEMDPEVVNDPVYANRIIDAMSSIPSLSIVMPINDLFNNANSPAGTGGIYPYSLAGQDADVPLKTVSSIVRLGTIATVTLPAHGYVNGDRIWIQNANQADFNGTFTIFGVTANTFQYNVPSTAATTATGSPIYAQKKNTPQLWERGTSVEWINPDGSNGFQVNAGIQIQGNASREPNKSGKHSFRLLFKTQYGASSLDYPVFGDAGANSFDSLILKAGFNNSWIHWDGAQRGKGTLISDRWASDTQIAMGDVSKHGQFVHLYLNGIYWGVYDVMERPEADFAASQFGGEADDYDVMNNEDKLIDGNRLAWDQMFNLVNNTDLSQTANYNAVKQYLDMPSFIDYILLNYYAGNLDWDDHNWYAARHSRVNGVPTNVGGFHFFSYDAENILNGTADYGPLSLDTDHRPTRLFQRLKNNADFRQLIGDRIHATFFNDGALTPTVAAARYRMEMAQVDPAVIGESARWGDYRKDVNQKAPNFNGTGILLTRDIHWVTETNRILSTYFPIRTFNILQQMRTLNLYPNMDAPEFNQLGGAVSPGFSLTMTNVSGGTVYYTLDGSDPRLSGGNVAPGVLTYTGPVAINSSAQVKARVYNPVSHVWSAITDYNFHVSPPPSLRITELMYNPKKPLGSLLDDDEYQYIELQNTGLTPLNLNGIILRGVDNFIFPNIMLSPGAPTLVVANQAAFESVYGAGLPIAGVFVGRLDHGGEKITLQTALGQIIEQFTYKDGWYNQTDGDGYSLVAVDPNATNDVLSTQEGWRASTTINGAPGASDPGLNNNSIVICEVLNNTATDPWIEFQNQTGADIDISGWFLTNDPLNLIKYALPANSIVPANGYLTLFQSTSFGAAFSLSPIGGELKLSSSYSGGQLGGYRDGVDFAAADPEVSFGRYIKSTGGSDFTAMTSPTPGAANSAPLVGPVVINEVMYNPSNGADEYIEIKNTSGAPIALHDGANGWQFTSGVGFTFAPGASLATDEIALIVPIDPAVFRTKYSIPAAVQIFGPYIGTLSNNGEKLALGKPIPGLLPATYVQVDRVNYNDGGSWPIYADGRGSSLQRKSATAYPNDLANWSASASGGTPGANNLLKNAPAVNAGPDASVNEAALFTANGSFVDLDAGETWTATVYWGDSGLTQALTLNANKTFTLNHNYVDNGVYTIIVTVTDSGKLFGIDTVTVTVNNVAPNGTTTGGAAVNEGIASSVNVATRTDVSSLDTTAGFFYNFDFDNNGAFETVNSTTPSIVVPAAYMDGPGVRQIHIRLIDKDGGFRDFLQNITVNNNNPPTATLINSGNVNEGAAGATVTFSIVNDVLADLASIRYAYDLDNDGTFDIGDGTYAGSAGNTNIASIPASLLAESGSRTIRGRVMDKDGGVNTYTTVILVNNVAPTATIANSGPAPEGSTTTTVSLTNLADTPGDIAAGFTYAYDFDNDFNFDLIGSDPSATIPASFLADGPSSRTLRVRITDRDAGSRDYTTVVTVSNIAPTIAAVSNKTIGMGSPLNVSGSVSDPGTDTFTATIDYGNGAGQQPLTINPDNTFSLSNTYATPGLYTATVRVTDDDGGAATPVSFNVTVRGSSLVGTAGVDNYYIRLDATHANVEFYENAAPPGQPTFVIPLASLTNISIDGGGGDDLLTIDFSNTSPIPSGGVSYAAGTPSSSDRLSIIGDGSISLSAAPGTTTGNGALTVGGRSINYTGVEVMNVDQFGGLTLTTPGATDSIFISRTSNNATISGSSGGTLLPPISITNTPVLTLDTAANDAGGGDDSISMSSTLPVPAGPDTFVITAGTGNNTLTINDGLTNLDTGGGLGGANLAVTVVSSSVVNFSSSQTLKSLTLNSAARINFAGSGNVLRVGGLTLEPAVTLDLAANDMIVQATPATRQTLLASIANWIKSARNTSPTRWQGQGITSTAAAADATRITGLAAILNDNGAGAVLYPTFDGQPADINSILVKYTYEGDANVSGQINADDYAAIDAGFSSHATGYAKGDFDWSGSINSDDYFIIDRTFSTQGAALGGVIESPQAPLAAQVTPSSPSTIESAPGAPAAPVAAASAAVPPVIQSESSKRSKHRHHKRSVDETRVWTSKSPNSDPLTRFLRRF
ncbi:MAG TPA: lamin tail domain-containing protein [Tepidisphaeraceae bacterium]|nr:lamin tail domain-containing protein [Tepidisphaeraceae bacterium]